MEEEAFILRSRFLEAAVRPDGDRGRCSTTVCNYPGSAQEQQRRRHALPSHLKGQTPACGRWRARGWQAWFCVSEGPGKRGKREKEMEGTRLLATFVSLHHWHGGKPQFSGNGDVAEDKVRFGCQMAEGDHHSHPRAICKH